MKFFRQQILKKGSSSSFDAPSSSEPFARRPTITRGQTYDPDTRETAEDEFIIPELSKEPAKGWYIRTEAMVSGIQTHPMQK